MNNAPLRRDGRWSHDMSYRRACIVVERVGGDMVLARIHLHAIIERRLTCSSAVGTPVAHQSVLAINEFATLEEVGKTIDAVVVERVGVKSLCAMFQHHIVTCVHHLVGAVVVGIVAGERERVALLEAHMSESLHRV